MTAASIVKTTKFFHFWQNELTFLFIQIRLNMSKLETYVFLKWKPCLPPDNSYQVIYKILIQYTHFSIIKSSTNIIKTEWLHLVSNHWTQKRLWHMPMGKSRSWLWIGKKMWQLMDPNTPPIEIGLLTEVNIQYKKLTESLPLKYSVAYLKWRLFQSIYLNLNSKI